MAGMNSASRRISLYFLYLRIAFAKGVMVKSERSRLNYLIASPRSALVGTMSRTFRLLMSGIDSLLNIVESCISSTQGQQDLRGIIFYHDTIFQSDYPVGMTNG